MKQFMVLGKQKGAALLTFMLVVVIGSSFLLVTRLNANINESKRIQDTYSNLVLAKQALIAYAVTYPDVVNNLGIPIHVDGQGNRFGPGYLPCPDRHTKSEQYFGKSGSGASTGGACALSTGTSIGRFPWKTLEINPMQDSSGEYFWYALSDGFRNNPKTYPLNSETQGELIVDGRTDIVAVIIAPGEALSGQDRSDSNFNDITKYLEGLNQQTGSFIRNFETTQTTDFNDKLIAITREDLMGLTEKRVLNEFRGAISSYREQLVDIDNTVGNDKFMAGTDGFGNPLYFVFEPKDANALNSICVDDYSFDTCKPVYTYKFPWLSPYAPQSPSPSSFTKPSPVISGTADSGSNALVLVDNDVDFTSLGIVVNDIVQYKKDGTIFMAAVNSVSNNTLTLSIGDNSNNQFDINDGDTYQIPRFNGIENTRQGHLPYHEDDEAFLTSYTLDWTALQSNFAVVAADTSVTHVHHQDGMKSAIQTSTGTTSSDVSVDFYSGSCIWTNINSTECVGRFTDGHYLRGTASTGTVVNPSLSRVKLVDSAKNFTEAGIKRGDLLMNYSTSSTTATISGSATAASGSNLLEDTGQNFVVSGIVPYYFVVEKDDTGEIGIIQQVTATTITLVSVDEANNISFADTDGYTIHPAIQSIVTEAGSVSNDTLNGIYIDGAATLDFDVADDYRIRVASKEMSDNATWPTPGGSNPAYVLYDSSADFSSVRVGDVIENNNFTAVGVVTAKGIRGDGIHWVAHTPLKGGTYDDIIIGETYTIYHNYIDKRQYDINVKMTSVYSEVKKTVNGEKIRNLCLDAACSGGTIEYNNGEPMLTLRDFDQDETEVGVATLTIPSAGISGSLKLAGVHMDLIKGTDLPQWVVDNEWHHLMYLAFSEDLSPNYVGGTDCQTNNNCLQILDPSNVDNDNIQSLVINAGRENTGQNRSIGAISDYFEFENSDNNGENDGVFEQSTKSNTFNDQIYVLQSIQ